MRRAALWAFVISAVATAACSGKDSPPARQLWRRARGVARHGMDRRSALLHDPLRQRRHWRAPAGHRAQRRLFVAGGGQIVVLLDTTVTASRTPPSARRSPPFRPATTASPSADHVYASSPTTSTAGPTRPATHRHRRDGDGRDGIPSGGHAARTLLDRRAEPPLRQHRQRRQRRRARRPTTPPATRAQIRRYDLSAIPAGGYAVTAGELFASGLRNEAGLSIDSQGRIWGVENGRDNLMVGGDIHFDNPGRGGEPVRHPTAPAATTATRSAGAKGSGSGRWRRGRARSTWIPTGRAASPRRCVRTQRHGRRPRSRCGPTWRRWTSSSTRGGYPAEFRGNLFVTSHGSWNRESGQVGPPDHPTEDGRDGPTEAETSWASVAGGELREGIGRSGPSRSASTRPAC